MPQQMTVIQPNVGVEKQQRTILIEAIDLYLRWRNDQSYDDGRGYVLGWFTWLRHWTNFGKTRAENLRVLLSNKTVPDSIKLLQRHLMLNSKIDNHSLDTYILEAVYKHKELFLSLFPNINAADPKILATENRESLRAAILGLQTANSIEYVYHTAQLYEAKNNISNHVKKACEYYATAVRADHAASITAIKNLANAGSAEAQYVLIFDYHHRRNEKTEAIKWCMRSAEQGHLKAQNYLLNTQFNAEEYLLIAKKYDQGDAFINRSRVSALIFFEKATALKNKEAAMFLGKLYQPNLNVPYILGSQETKDAAQKSFDCYLIAAQQGDIVAMDAIVNIAEYVNDDALHSKLNALSATKAEYANSIAELYKNKNQPKKSCVYFSIATQRHHVASQQQLDALLNSTEMRASDITDLGKKYHEGSNGITRDDAKARAYFVKAIEKEKGAAAAYYELGLMYKTDASDGVKKNIVIATQYFQLAVNHGFLRPGQMQLDAIFNSRETTSAELAAIAAMYRDGCDGITKNTELALTLTKKSCERGSPSASLYLGHFFQVDHEGVQKNPSLAFSYYLQAAKLGNRDALVPLEILGEETSAENQSKLSQIFRGALFPDARRAFYWETKANEVSQFQLKK